MIFSKKASIFLHFFHIPFTKKLQLCLKEGFNHESIRLHIEILAIQPHKIILPERFVQYYRHCVPQIQ